MCTPKQVCLISFFVFLVATLALPGFAQVPAGQMVIAVSIDGTRAGIAAWQPRLMAEAVSTVEKAAPNARAVTVSSDPAKAAGEARQSGADYLLRIVISNKASRFLRGGGNGVVKSLYVEWSVDAIKNHGQQFREGWSPRLTEPPRTRLDVNRPDMTPEYSVWLTDQAVHWVHEASSAAIRKLESKSAS